MANGATVKSCLCFMLWKPPWVPDIIIILSPLSGLPDQFKAIKFEYLIVYYSVMLYHMNTDVNAQTEYFW